MIVLPHIVLRLLADLAGLIALSVRPWRAIEAENLVLRRQLALFKERGMKPRRIDSVTHAPTLASAPARKCHDKRAKQPVATTNRRLTRPTGASTLSLVRLN